jgi:histone acetyltransferase (RNA polymerase elongator complex component)
LEHGFVLGGQMMIGLPDATEESECRTARKICEMGADEVRIYPTVVFRDTALAQMTEKGEYIPLTVEQAAERSAAVLRIFLEHHVKVLRIGLCASEELASPQTALAGPNHPALGELVWNAYYYRLMTELLEQQGLLGKKVILHLPSREQSKVIGQKRANILRLKRETGTEVCRVQAEKTAGSVFFSLLAQR